MTFSEGEINAIIRDDSEVETVLPRDYSTIIHDTLRNNYHNVKTSITRAPNKITSEFQVRLANLRPDNFMGHRNYWPSRIDDSPNLVRMVKSILMTQFAARRVCVKINFSISLLILDPEDSFSPITFLWSSRSNNCCLDSSYTIESYGSLNRFVDEVVAPFSIENHLLKKLEQLEQRYSGECMPLALNFYATVDTSTIFGARKTYAQRSLSNNECDTTKTCNRESDCLWKALSSLVTIDDSNRPILRRCKRKRVNERIAKRLKMQFKKWYNRQAFKSDYFTEPISSRGYDCRFFSILERFLQMGIVLVDHLIVKKKRIGFFGLVDTDKKARCLRVKFASKEKTTETVYLATDGQNHIRCVTNLPIFAHKFICESCGKSYRYACELKRHKCKEDKFAASSLQKWIYSLPVNIEKTLGFENKLKSDTKCIHVLVNAVGGGNSGFNVKMFFSLLGQDILTKSVNVPDMDTATKTIAKNCTKAALIVLGERMANNFKLLKKLEEECNAITLTTDPLRVENLLAAKRGLVDFLSSFACYVQAGTAENLNTGDVMHSLISTLSEENQCTDFNIRFGGNVLQGVCVKGSPVKYMNLAEFAPIYKAQDAVESHVVDWANVLTKFEDYFGLNITGMTPGQIGHHLLANNMTTVEKRMFLTSTVEFQRKTFKENVRYGILSFNGEKIVNQNTPEKAIIAVDFSKYYFSILTDPEKPKWLTVGMPIRYAERGKDGIFLPEKTRRRKTIANLFLRLMEEVFETQIISLLHSREIRINGKPIDGYMEIDGKPTVIEFSGCSYHGRDETDITEQTHNGTCHLPKNVIEVSDPEHFKNCEICKNAESKDYNFAKPSLWRLRNGETSDSKHFFHKDRTYREIYAETKEKNNNLEKAGFKLLVVWECHVLKYWNKPLSEFFAQWHLTPKGRYANEVLGHMMGQVCLKAFPLSQYPYLTERRIIDSVKQGTLNGFVTITAKSGEKTKQILQSVKPFFYRDSNGNPSQSFDVEKRCVSTCLLRELLTNKLLDFNIIRIHDVFEYTLATTNPFSRIRNPVQDALGIEGSSTFTKVLKSTVNRTVGSLNFNATKHKKSILILEEEIPQLKTSSSLSHCTRVNSTTVMMHLKNERPVSNSSHMHLGIVATGVAVMLRYICSMRHFLHTTVERVNTDGLIAIFGKRHFPESLTMNGSLSLPFDAFLRRDCVSAKFVADYVQWKKEYFRHLGFCPIHEKQYVDFLLANETCFMPFQCCRDYVNLAAKFAILVEFTGDYAKFKSVNSLIVLNSLTRAKYVKGTMYQNYEGDMFDE